MTLVRTLFFGGFFSGRATLESRIFLRLELEQTTDGNKEAGLSLNPQSLERLRYQLLLNSLENSFPNLEENSFLGRVLLRTRDRSFFVGDRVYEYADFNKARPQFEDRQDIYSPEEVEKRPEISVYLKNQIVAHLSEHALNRHLFEFFYEIGPDKRIRAPYQQTDKPFTKERLKDLVDQARGYLVDKFGFLPRETEFDWLDNNFELIGDILFDEEFRETRAGLELAELIGLRKFEKMGANAENGDMLVLFSPWSPLRQTPRQYNFTMFGFVEEGNIRIVSVRNGSKDEDKDTFLGNYLSIYKSFSGKSAQKAQDAVSSPVLVKGVNKEVVIDWLEQQLETSIDTDSEIIGFYDKTIEENIELVEELVTMMTDGKHEVSEITEKRRELEIAVVATHRELISEYKQRKELSEMEQKLVDFIQSGYFAGGLCGIGELMETMMGPMMGLGAFGYEEYGDKSLPDVWICKECKKALHHIDHSNPSTFFENCQRCKASGRC